MPPAKTTPPSALIDAFRALEKTTDVGALMVEDGFDAITMRVFAAWEKTVQRWNRPHDLCPEGGAYPTAAAWTWLIEGWTIDYAAIAEGACVSREVARERMAALIRNRLVYPDGSASKHATQALQATVASRLVKAGAKKNKKKDDASSN